MNDTPAMTKIHIVISHITETEEPYFINIAAFYDKKKADELAIELNEGFKKEFNRQTEPFFVEELYCEEKEKYNMWTHELPTESGIYYITKRNSKISHLQAHVINVEQDGIIQWIDRENWLTSIVTLKEPHPNFQFLKADTIPTPIWD